MSVQATEHHGRGDASTRAPEGVRRTRPGSAYLAREYGIALVVVALFVTLSIASPNFLTTDNLLNLLRQNAAIGIIACAGTLVVIAGGFDLSVGAVYFLSGIVAAWVAVHVSVPLGLLSGVVLGGVLGLVNGELATRLKISTFLATLATSLAFAGVGAALTKGFAISVADPSFAKFGNGGLGNLTYPVIIFVVTAVVLQVLLWRGVAGRYIFAVGGNAEAARNSGVRVDTIRVVTFVVSGIAAGLAGVLDASTVSSGGSDTGVSLPLTAIAAVALGGTSIYGGAGAVWRTVLGVLLLAMIANGLDLVSVASYYQDILKGALIVVAVAVNSLATSR
ncbi:MAG: inner-rane translocator [Solirubrobacterales bacterium]|nr:inner-rane translocator [Solirubrobacterales bacterium]